MPQEIERQGFEDVWARVPGRQRQRLLGLGEGVFGVGLRLGLVRSGSGSGQEMRPVDEVAGRLEVGSVVGSELGQDVSGEIVYGEEHR